MTEDQRIEDMLALAHRVRSRILVLIDEINAIPDELGPIANAFTTWRVALLTLIWDVSEAPLVLASSRSESYRAMRIITRSLFEYAVHLEFYVYDRIGAIRDWHNSQSWLKGVVKGGVGQPELLKMTKDERRAYNEMMRIDGAFEYSDFSFMLRTVFKRRGYDRKEVKRAVRQATNFYTVSSSLVHGSQGAFYDLFTHVTDSEWKLHHRSFRIDRARVVYEATSYLILALFAESLHRKKDLSADMHLRELDLITGDWEPILG